VACVARGGRTAKLWQGCRQPAVFEGARLTHVPVLMCRSPLPHPTRPRPAAMKVFGFLSALALPLLALGTGTYGPPYLGGCGWVVAGVGSRHGACSGCVGACVRPHGRRYGRGLRSRRG
jgi:hypothetical protein